MSRRARLHYIPIDAALPGMVLGEAVKLSERGVLRLHLPAGHVLNDTSLRQLLINRAEYLCITQPDTRSDAQVANDAAAAAADVMRIFAGADLGQPALAALFDRILTYRSQ